MSAESGSAHAADLQPTVDAQHPWLGLASFTEETRGYFHGRDDEVAELSRRVQRKALSILFGQSGLGKTSILRAGMVPRLRAEGFCPVYVRIDYSPDTPSPAEQIKLAIFRATEGSGHWTQPGAAVEGETLWEFLHHRDDTLRDESGNAVTPLLIFDQFEEIFTLAQADDAGRKRAAEFIEDLADLVENRLPKALEARLDQDDSVTDRFDFGRADYRILIALREDYLAHLEGVKDVMPSITQNRMRLARMNGQQALSAVLKPGGDLVSQEVAEAIVRFTGGGAELRNAEVEPSLLSLICRELNNVRIAQGRAEISADLLAGTHDTILADFYERALADQPEAVRTVIEDQLLTESGFRESLAEERVINAFAAAGAAPDALAKLVNRRLLRIEERLDVRRVELTHDVLCGVVKASRALRLEREALEAAERKLVAQREREATTRKALIRARQVASVCIGLAIVAIAAAAFGVIGMQRAQNTHRMAETARGESERLVVYLLDDFYRELTPVGRTDIVGELAKRAIDYYKGLPAALKTPDTERNEALAQVRYGDVLRSQGQVPEARAMLEGSIATLDRLRAAGDSSEATAIGLSLGLTSLSRAGNTFTASGDVLIPVTRAAALLAPLATAPDASISLRRAYGSVTTALGFGYLRQSRDEDAVKMLEISRAMYKGVDGLATDSDAASSFSIASAWEVESLLNLGRNDDAKRVGQEGIRAASDVIDRLPTHMIALRGRGLVNGYLGRVAAQELQRQRELDLVTSAAADWSLIARIDPKNVIAWNNWGVQMGEQADALTALGRPREAIDLMQGFRAEFERHIGNSVMLADGQLGGIVTIATYLGDVGDNAGAERIWNSRLPYYEILKRSFVPGSFDTQVYGCRPPMSRARLWVAQGEWAQARSAGTAALACVDQLKPTTDFGRKQVDDMRRTVLMSNAIPAFETRDFAATERFTRTAVTVAKGSPLRTTDQIIRADEETTLLAAALAKLGRADEAKALIEPVLASQRKLSQMPGNDDQQQRFDLVAALYANALADPSQAKLLMAEARALYASLSKDFRALRSTALYGDRLAEVGG